MYSAFCFIRSLIFTLVMIVATVIWAPICFLFAPLPYNARYRATALWNVFIIWAAKVICGIRYEKKGFENFPDSPIIVLSKHQSAWETIFLLMASPRPLVFVFKKSILYIPFFGWGIALLKMIPIDRINILNPRARNQKIFFDIATNITQVGLKRPITVTNCQSGAVDKDYDLVCGQGRIEAFIACGQSHIPALVIDANEEQALIMSLFENLARFQHQAMDLLQGVAILQKQGYDRQAIAKKTGLTLEDVRGVLKLMERGEERLLRAVESGHMPISLAIKVAESPDGDQQALQEAYESKQLRGRRFLAAKRLIESRKRRGKTFAAARPNHRGGQDKALTARDILKVYQREVDRKRVLTRKADVVGNRLLFVTEALRRLLGDDNFSNLFRAEGLTTLPKPLAELMEAKGGHHA